MGPIELGIKCHYFTFKDTQVFDIKGPIVTEALQVWILKCWYCHGEKLSYSKKSVYPQTNDKKLSK